MHVVPVVQARGDDEAALTAKLQNQEHIGYRITRLSRGRWATTRRRWRPSCKSEQIGYRVMRLSRRRWATARRRWRPSCRSSATWRRRPTRCPAACGRTWRSCRRVHRSSDARKLRTWIVAAKLSRASRASRAKQECFRRALHGLPVCPCCALPASWPLLPAVVCELELPTRAC